MTREEVKALLPILQAFADGKILQYYNCGDWVDVKDDENLSLINYPKKYRIKPESKYRPFKNTEECWNEMLKHQPFGWIKSKITGNKYHVTCIEGDYAIFIEGNFENRTLKGFFTDLTFADGCPFGVKVEE